MENQSWLLKEVDRWIILFLDVPTVMRSAYEIQFLRQIALSFTRYFLFICEYAFKSTLRSICTKTSIYYGNTGVKYAKMIRDLFLQYVKDGYLNFQFEDDIAIEIDESLFGKKVKHNRGNPGNESSKI